MHITRLIPVVLVVGAAAYPIVYLILAWQRMTFPLELEWMEGATVTHVQRILDGYQIYSQPSLEFVPFLYSPLYYYISSVVAAAMGNGFLALRLVSVVASIGCCALIFDIVYRRVRSRLAATLAVCFFAATYPLTGSWFDLARVDSLFLLFLLAGIRAFLSPRPVVRSMVAAGLLFLAFFTKQSALIVALGLSTAAASVRPGWERVALPIGFGALAVASSLLMNAITDGWYGYYIFDLPRRLPFPASWPGDFWVPDLLGLDAVSIAFVFAVLTLLPFPAGRSRIEIVEDAAILGSLCLVSYLLRLAGGYTNVLMPLYAGIAIYCGIGFERMSQVLQPPAAARTIAAVALTVQFALLAYAPWFLVPKATAAENGDRFLTRVRSIPGSVYLPDHPWYLRLAGKPMTGHEEAVGDVVLADLEGWGARLKQDFAEAVSAKKYDAVVVDFENFALRPDDFDRHYQLVESELTAEVFWPIAGGLQRPTYLYLPRK